MKRLLRLLGSLHMAVAMLITIAVVLAWGTIYETRFGTAAVQRFIYHAWWFQLLLGFLAVNLTVAAVERYPWQRRHVPFILAHIGIILILIGGIIGARFGVEGQMLIPEGEAEHVIEQPGNVFVVHQPNPGLHRIIPVNFETQAWVHEPNAVFAVPLDGRTIQLTVDRYYPDAVTDERITDGGPEENPAVHVILAHEEQQEAFWLFARDPERFGMGWGEVHVLFLEPQTPQQLEQLLGRTDTGAHPRGVLMVRLPGSERLHEIPVPVEPHPDGWGGIPSEPTASGRGASRGTERSQEIAIKGTPYRLTFKDYFPDFAITEQGVTSRSMQPNNPAVAFTLTGPEGSDPYLLFALHPDFSSIHGVEHTIPAQITYVHEAGGGLPPQAIGIVRSPDGTLMGVLTGGSQDARQVIETLEVGTRYTHPALGYQFEVAAHYPKAILEQQIRNRSNDVKAEMVHLVAREGEQTAEVWLGLRGDAELALGKEPVRIEYRPARRDVPFTVKLLDFRKIDYPGTQMASGFEADVQLTDSKRGVILMRKISMNNPLRYRGYSLYQSSYIEGPTETTILSLRNDPGTPLVYAGFLIVVAGVVSMFVFRGPAADAAARPRKQPKSTRSRSR